MYAQQPSASGNEQYAKSEQQTSIQYVTPQQYEKGILFNREIMFVFMFVTKRNVFHSIDKPM